MRTSLIIATLLLTATTLGANISASYAQVNCNTLYVERNSYYKQAGYCFKTARAISTFGNAGCRYNDQDAVPLSSGTRNRIAQIVRQEKNLGCND